MVKKMSGDKISVYDNSYMGRGRIYENFLDTIGSTPLVRISKFAKSHDCAADLVCKLEFFNPLASVKSHWARHDRGGRKRGPG